MQASFFEAHIQDTGPNYIEDASVSVLIVRAVGDDDTTQAVPAATMRAILILLNLLTCTLRSSLLMKSRVTLRPQTPHFTSKPARLSIEGGRCG
jgi:hypothetical protein